MKKTEKKKKYAKRKYSPLNDTSIFTVQIGDLFVTDNTKYYVLLNRFIHHYLKKSCDRSLILNTFHLTLTYKFYQKNDFIGSRIILLVIQKNLRINFPVALIT